ncbi:carboxypeptidase-like regulatory domain-containing protein [Balneolaceae bacterium YR4-1]|uniref:Carboxypeptidase-like regulatory domain-containing protein n=1 Tax=Halalkalibaculum roseum TaxID=2709311 RepID=A0A6M1SRB1_9BACT|nr:carboxypeptidase-like regulatory domain-containing protein [Halalkalibaculum roseum]
MFLFSTEGTSHLYAQAVIEGRVIDSESKNPLQGTHVFLSGTKIGTSTDTTGRYILKGIPAGAHRLVISMIGYGRKTFDLKLGPEEIKTMDFGLKPVVYEMNEIYAGDLDKKWKKRLEHFEELFIGETKWAESVVILNPEVLRFDANFWGRLNAKALAPLRIENRALGYHITYYLDEFTHNGTRTRWDGEPLFTEMTSSDSLQQARWEQNRREAFYGSLRHFWLALLQDRLKEEGFLLYNLRESSYRPYPNNRYRISPKRLISQAEEEYLHHIRFFGRLEIIYTRDKEDRRYLEWTRNFRRGVKGSQVSWLELNERPITLDEDGEVLEPYGATQMGYFAFHRLADLTPREYRPEGFVDLK